MTDYHVCRGNQFTPKGNELLEEAVKERNSVGGMTELKLMIDRPWPVIYSSHDIHASPQI